MKTKLKRYIDNIHNSGKRAYAQRMASFFALTSSEPDWKPHGISYMDAQAVRENVRRLHFDTTTP